jgi:hypothetical protein
MRAIEVLAEKASEMATEANEELESLEAKLKELRAANWKIVDIALHSPKEPS